MKFQLLLFVFTLLTAIFAFEFDPVSRHTEINDAEEILTSIDFEPEPFDPSPEHENNHPEEHQPGSGDEDEHNSAGKLTVGSLVLTGAILCITL